jgi:hypothetical protein
VTFGHHVVALIDFLGQGNELANWDFYPASKEESKHFMSAVVRNWEHLSLWRETFKHCFLWAAMECHKLPLLLELLPSAAQTELRQARKFSYRIMHFSDTIIFYAPLQNEHGYWQTDIIWGLLFVCGSSLLEALSRRTVFRGAIEVGMAAQFEGSDFYGPALAKAHYLESKVAEYPRILVGPTLLDYLHIKRYPQNDEGDAISDDYLSISARMNRFIAERCMGILFEDADGQWIVDYLGDTFMSVLGDAAPQRELQQLALAFVTSQVDRFRRKEGELGTEEKLADRYERLRAYFCSRGSSRPEASPSS